MTHVQEGAATNIALQYDTARQPFDNTALRALRPAMAVRGDAIRRTGPRNWTPIDVPPGQTGGGPMGIISQLVNIVQQLLSMLGMGGISGSMFGNAQQTPDTYFQNATASSTGDPHLSFNGSHFDSMTSHSDLLDSDSFAGGYQISTDVTQPGANGVTFNQQATVSTGFGQTQVSLDKNGNATILQNGTSFALADGQSMQLGDGETVTRNADGSVVVADTNGMGAGITTTLSENGAGVDVNTQASNVDLGGDLVNQGQAPLPVRTPFPVLQPM